MGYLYLVLAVAAEVAATTSLKASEQFTRPLASLVVVLGYALAFYSLSLVLRTIPVGYAYAIWSGLGIASVTAISAYQYRQIPDTAGWIGLSMIVLGVMAISLFSKTVSH